MIHTHAASLRGRPVAWFTQAQHDRRRKLQSEAATNQQLTCVVPGCDQNRFGVSKLCRRHTNRMRKTGDPIATLPPKDELEVFERIIRGYREGLSQNVQERVCAEERHQSRIWQRPVSWAALPSEMHRRIPQRGKAEIIRAHMTKDGRDFARFFVRALAVEGWTKAFFDGLPQYRNRFIHTQTGAWATKKSLPSKTYTSKQKKLDRTIVLFAENGHRHPTVEEIAKQYHRAHISGTVKAILGKDALESANQIYCVARGEPKGTFWDQTIETADTGEMSLLDYARQAASHLQAAYA